MCGRIGDGDLGLSCFVLISLTRNQTTQSWQALRPEMGLMRVKGLPVSRSAPHSLTLHRLTHSWGAPVHVSVKMKGSELNGEVPWSNWSQITAHKLTTQWSLLSCTQQGVCRPQHRADRACGHCMLPWRAD